MSVEIYQGAQVAPTSVSTFNAYIDALFTQAGYSVTTDLSSGKITVKSGGNIFGLAEIKLPFNAFQQSVNGFGYSIVVDKGQRTLIVVSAKPLDNTYDVGSSTYKEIFARPVVIADGVDIWAGKSAPKPFASLGSAGLWNFPAVDVSRTSGQPVVLTVAVSSATGSICEPLFVCANGVFYPLGTIIQDGSSKFISDGNGLAIRVKE